MDKWVNRMLGVAETIATWSDDINNLRGVVITDEDYNIVSTGYNGYPRIVDNSVEVKCMLSAELNALLTLNVNVYGLRMFIHGGHPDTYSASCIIKKCIKTVHCPEPDANSKEYRNMFAAQKMLKGNPWINYINYKERF